MPFSSNNLLKQLDRAGTIDWTLELKNREESLAFLLQAVPGNLLNRRQLHNAMHALFRIAFPENAGKVLQTFEELCAHSDIAIRSEAVQLAIGVIRTSRKLKTPMHFTPEQENAVREAMSRGLSAQVSVLAHRFFAT